MTSTTFQNTCLGLATVLFLGAGCQSEDPMFAKDFQPPKIRWSGDDAKKEFRVQRPLIKFAYHRQGRDPFRHPYHRWVKPTKTCKKRQGMCRVTHTKTANAPKSRLESFELEQLKLVAVVTSIANPMAIVEDTNGHGYVVRVGTAMGKLSGRVSKIHPHGLTIQMTYRRNARRHFENIFMPLQTEAGQLANGTVLIGKQKVHINQHGEIRSTNLVETRMIY